MGYDNRIHVTDAVTNGRGKERKGNVRLAPEYCYIDANRGCSTCDFLECMYLSATCRFVVGLPNPFSGGNVDRCKGSRNDRRTSLIEEHNKP